MSESSGTFHYVSVSAIDISLLLTFTAGGLWTDTARILDPCIYFMAGLFGKPSAAPKISEPLAIWAVVSQEISDVSKNNR